MKKARMKREARGRKRVITGEVEQRLLRFLADRRINIRFACRLAGVSRRTYYDECARNRVFKGKAFEARNRPQFIVF